MDILALEPETIANPAEVSDADAEAAYEKIAGKDPRFGAPEKRDLQQILFPNEADASAAEAKLKAGASFDDLVKERGLKPEDTDLGETTKDAMLDKAEADAVFALPQGGVSGVLKSQFGPVIVRVKSITPSTMKPFAEVADEVKRQVSASRAGDKIQALHDKIEDLRVSGKSLIEAAKAVGLTGQSIAAVDAEGRDPKGAPVNLPDKAELLRAAFASDVGLDEAPINTKDGGFVWFDITKVDPAHDLTFEEAKPEVEKQWRAEEVDKALAGKADDLVKQIKAGASVADAAKSAGAEVKSASGRPSGRADQPAGIRRRRDLPRARRRRGVGGDAGRAGGVQDHRRQDAAGRFRRRPRQGDGLAARTRDPREPARPVCRSFAPDARRRRPSGSPAIGRGRLTADDHPARLRSVRARLWRRRGRGRGDDAGRRSRDPGLGLSQARARPRRATCSCSNRSRAGRSAAAIR